MKLLVQGMSTAIRLLMYRILEKLSTKLKLEGDFDFLRLAKLTPGYVGADLNALTSEAGMIAVQRVFETLGASIEDSDCQMDVADGNSTTPTTIQTLVSKFMEMRSTPLSPEELQTLCITHDDFVKALKKVQPSAKREGFATVPGVSWEDIGALSKVRDELRMAIVEPVRHPEYFVSVGISSPMGVLLYGPPGCGKTLLAKAVANESHCNFISVKGPELLNKVFFLMGGLDLCASTWVKVNALSVWYLRVLLPLRLVSSFSMNWTHFVLLARTIPR